MKDTYTEYPLFGKANFVKDDIFGDWAFKKGGIISSPAIGNGDITTEVTIGTNVKVHIFSNGSEADDWNIRNCNRCKKSRDENIFTVDSVRCGGCALEVRIAIACLDDGTIPMKTVKRIGYKYLGIQRNGVFAHLGHCKEFEQK